MPTDDERLRKLWLHFLHSFALSDHLGDAAEAVRSFGQRAGWPVPGDYAEIGLSSDGDPEESWAAWLKHHHQIEDGIDSNAAKEVAGADHQ